jgi:hypothetical protein
MRWPLPWAIRLSKWRIGFPKRSGSSTAVGIERSRRLQGMVGR